MMEGYRLLALANPYPSGMFSCSAMEKEVIDGGVVVCRFRLDRILVETDRLDRGKTTDKKIKIPQVHRTQTTRWDERVAGKRVPNKSMRMSSEGTRLETTVAMRSGR